MSLIDAPLINWQKNYKTWPKRMGFIKQKEDLADFKFIVGPEKTIFHAHKLIFAISSPEFENLFYLLNINMKEICLPQISSATFNQFLNFVYTGTMEISMENIGDLLKLSKLYYMTLLTDECAEFLQITISKDNVFQVLNVSDELPAVQLKCLEIIGKNAIELFQSSEFVKISKKSLKKIVEYEMLPCKEIVLFEALDKWALNAQLVSRTENRRVHVDDLIPKIRFSSMSLKEFGKCTVDTILTSNEIADIVRYKTLPTYNPFFLKQRLIQTIKDLPLEKCLRFNNCSTSRFISLGGKIVFSMTIDKHIYLCGYGIYGRSPQALIENKTAIVKIRLTDDTDVVLSERTSKISFDGTTNIIDIFFKSMVLLEPSKIYKIYINRSGPSQIFQSFSGFDGRTEILENGVNFKITRNNNSALEYDTAREGPIASILFKKLNN